MSWKTDTDKNNQGCQFSDFSLISDFLRTAKTSIKIDQMWSKYMYIYKISKVSKDRLDSDKWLENPCLNTVSKH